MQSATDWLLGDNSRRKRTKNWSQTEYGVRLTVGAIVRPGSHGCKIWLFVREALQFPWILQQNLEAAARSEEKREAAGWAASRASPAAAAEKSAGCSACNVRTNVRSRSSSLVFSFCLFFYFYFFWKRELSRQMRTFSSSAAFF